MHSGSSINKSIQINADPSKVWNALINPEIISQYFTEAKTITDWQIGSEIIFIHEYKGQEFRNKGVILDFVPNHLLRYTYWTIFSQTEDQPENYTTITYSLSHFNGGTKLLLIQTNFKNVEWYEALQTGWDQVLAKIKELVENNSNVS